MAERLNEKQLRENIAGWAEICPLWREFMLLIYPKLDTLFILWDDFLCFLCGFIEILKKGDLATLTSKKIRQILENKFEVDLKDR